MASASTGALPQVPVFPWTESQVSIAHAECTEWTDVCDDFGKGGPAPLRRPGCMESDDPYGERPVPSQFDLELKGVGGQGGSQDCGHDAKHDPCAGDPETWCPIPCAALSHAVGDGAHIPLPVLSYVIDSETVDYVTTAVTRATRLPSLCRFSRVLSTRRWRRRACRRGCSRSLIRGGTFIGSLTFVSLSF